MFLEPVTRDTIKSSKLTDQTHLNNDYSYLIIQIIQIIYISIAFLYKWNKLSLFMNYIYLHFVSLSSYISPEFLLAFRPYRFVTPLKIIKENQLIVILQRKNRQE